MLPRLRKLAETYPMIADVRGRGAMIAVELTKPGTLEPDPAAAAAVSAACHRAGLVVLTCGTFGNVLRFLPPLVIGEDLLEEGLDILENAFALCRSRARPGRSADGHGLDVTVEVGGAGGAGWSLPRRRPADAWSMPGARRSSSGWRSRCRRRPAGRGW